jgi:hypothetical protein
MVNTPYQLPIFSDGVGYLQVRPWMNYLVTVELVMVLALNVPST